MPLSIVVTTSPSIEPLSVIEAKDHLRVDGDDDEVLIAAYIKAAREFAEAYTGRTLINTVYTLSLDKFPTSSDAIEIPAAPLASVTSISYVDTDGATDSMDSSDYRVDTSSEPGRITVAYGNSWPSTRDITNAVSIVYTGGYGTSRDDVPEGIRMAMRLLVGHMYENREAVVIGTAANELPLAVESLLDAYRVSVLVI